MTASVWVGGENSRFPAGMTDRKARARARATAGPSISLRFAQDDSICLGCRRKQQIPWRNDKK
jgi:hypothetical protein